jgi:hypothetical protein
MYQIFLPLPNPPLVKGRELDFIISPLHKGGLRGVKALKTKVPALR